jgi:hypothetical protein
MESDEDVKCCATCKFWLPNLVPGLLWNGKESDCDRNGGITDRFFKCSFFKRKQSQSE